MIYCSHQHLFAPVSQHIYQLTPRRPPTTALVDGEKGDRLQSLKNKDCTFLIHLGRLPIPTWT